MEEWKDIPGYKNEYKISNCGRVLVQKKVESFSRIKKIAILRLCYVRMVTKKDF